MATSKQKMENQKAGLKTPPVVSPQEGQGERTPDPASRAQQEDRARLEARMGWEMPWHPLTDSFDVDFGGGQWHGHNAFSRDGERVFRTYFINGRGDEAMGTTWSYLDMTALGRQETWEDSPEGYPQSRPYKWWNWHDSYVPGAAPDPKWVKVSDAGEAAFRKREA